MPEEVAVEAAAIAARVKESGVEGQRRGEVVEEPGEQKMPGEEAVVLEQRAQMVQVSTWKMAFEMLAEAAVSSQWAEAVPCLSVSSF